MSEYKLPKSADRDSLLKDFKSMMDDIRSIDPKLKVLWYQIYDNAVNDRLKAEMAYNDLFLKMKSENDSHALLGPILSKYLERLEKSNKNIIDLVSLIQTVKNKEDEESIPKGDDLYSQMEKEKPVSNVKQFKKK